MPSPLLLMAVIEALSCETMERLPRELFDMANLVLVAESMGGGEFKVKVLRWKLHMEAKGLNLDINKTKVMVSGKKCGEGREVAVRCLLEWC